MAVGWNLVENCRVLVILGVLLVATGAQKLPDTVQCVDDHCTKPLGHFVASQNYVPDSPSKLAFSNGDKLLLLGESNGYYYAKVDGSDRTGLLAKMFVKRPIVEMPARVQVSLPSLSPTQASPTPTVACVVDGTVFDVFFRKPGEALSGSDSDMCSLMQSTPSVAPPSPVAATEEIQSEPTEGYFSSLARGILSTLGQEVEPSAVTSEMPSTVTQQMEQSPQDDANGNENMTTSKISQEGGEVSSNEETDKLRSHADVVGRKPLESKDDDGVVLESEEDSVDKAEGKPEGPVQTGTAGVEKSTDEDAKEEVPSSPSGGTIPSIAKSDQHAPNDSTTDPEIEEDKDVVKLEGPLVVEQQEENSVVEPIVEEATADQKPPSTVSGPLLEKEEGGDAQQVEGVVDPGLKIEEPNPEVQLTPDDVVTPDQSTPEVKKEEVASVAEDPTASPANPEIVAKDETAQLGHDASMIGTPSPIPAVVEVTTPTAEDSATPAPSASETPTSSSEVSEDSPAAKEEINSAETPSLQVNMEPRVTFGRPAPKDLPPPVIRPTRAGHGHSHFNTRGHGHSHGGHGHSHGEHGHSHGDNGHSHDDPGHTHAADTSTPQVPIDPLTAHSYPGEKPDSHEGVVDDTKVKEIEGDIKEGGAEASIPTDVPNTGESSHSESTAKIMVPPIDYTENTVAQTCERKDGVECEGDSVEVPKVPVEDIVEEPVTNKRRKRDESIDSALREYVGLVLSVIPDPLYSSLLELEERGVSSHVVVLTFLCGFVGSFLLIFFTCIAQSSKEGVLSDYIARLEQQLFTLKKEREIILDESKIAPGITQTSPEDAEKHDREVEALQEIVNRTEQESMRIKLALEKYQDALKQAEDNYGDLEQARECEREEYDLKQQELAQELNELRIQNEEYNEKFEKSNADSKERDEEMMTLQETNAQLLTEATVWDQRVKELTGRLETEDETLSRTNKELSDKAAEVEALKESLKKMDILERAQLAAGDGDEDDVMQRLINVQLVQTEAEEVSKKNKHLEEEIEEARKNVEEWKGQVIEVKSRVEKAEREREEALQKLNVLTEYFKDKELKLQRDVVMQESLRQQKESDALSIGDQLDLYKEQNTNMQQQMSSMKEELDICERKYKRQLMEQEKKTHDNWMAYKNSVKTQEELQAEMAIMRQQLIQLKQEREAAERLASLPQDRPRPPPALPMPLPLPKGISMSMPPLPLPIPNGIHKGEMPSPPMQRYIEGARRTPPVGPPLPPVLYQKSGSSRQSSDRKKRNKDVQEVKESNGRSNRSGGSKGLSPPPEMRRSTTQRRSDRSPRDRR